MSKTYLVGGAVRDKLLGIASKDLDFVVVGSTEDEMLAKGYEKVGTDFPVFLHPETRNEYALARQERKSGNGYHGFECNTENVSLKDDLMRRDLTINAMAMNDKDNIIDYFGGQEDLKNGILRHVSIAFADDPVRVLRIARFSARYGFSVADETMELMRKMVANDELEHLTPERVVKEFEKGLMEKSPRKMIEVLRECGALKVIMPELDCLWGIPQVASHHPEVDTGEHIMLSLEQSAKMNLSFAERWATLLHDLGKGITPEDILPKHISHDEAGVKLVRNVCSRLKTDKESTNLALLVCEYHIKIHQIKELRKGKKAVALLQSLDAFRKPERLKQILNVCLADKRGRLGKQKTEYPEFQYILDLLNAVTSIDTQAIVQKCNDLVNDGVLDRKMLGQKISAEIQNERCKSAAAFIKRAVKAEKSVV